MEMSLLNTLLYIIYLHEDRGMCDNCGFDWKMNRCAPASLKCINLVNQGLCFDGETADRVREALETIEL